MGGGGFQSQPPAKLPHFLPGSLSGLEAVLQEQRSSSALALLGAIAAPPWSPIFPLLPQGILHTAALMQPGPTSSTSASTGPFAGLGLGRGDPPCCLRSWWDRILTSCLWPDCWSHWTLGSFLDVASFVISGHLVHAIFLPETASHLSAWQSQTCPGSSS